MWISGKERKQSLIRYIQREIDTGHIFFVCRIIVIRYSNILKTQIKWYYHRQVPQSNTDTATDVYFSISPFGFHYVHFMVVVLHPSGSSSYRRYKVNSHRVIQLKYSGHAHTARWQPYTSIEYRNRLCLCSTDSVHYYPEIITSLLNQGENIVSSFVTWGDYMTFYRS